MARIISCLTCFVFIVMTGHVHHPKFAKAEEDFTQPTLSIVACTGEHSSDQDNLIEQSRCNQPKEVFEYLKRHASYEQASPRAVWVKRCVGVCVYDDDSSGTCVATETTTRNVNVRIYSLETNKESCATYPITDHVKCGCPPKTA